MGLSSTEMMTLSSDVIKLWKKIQEIKSEDSPSGVKISRREGKELLKMVIQLAAKLSLDLID